MSKNEAYVQVYCAALQGAALYLATKASDNERDILRSAIMREASAIAEAITFEVTPG